jgi:very-short-patch-repair endonuclease
MVDVGDIELARLARAHDGVFSLAEARTAGLSDALIDWRVRSGAWEAVHHGVYRIAGSPPSWLADLRAACLAAGEGAVVSHRAAARIYQLPGGRDDIVEISCHRWRRTQQPGLVVHESTRLQPIDIQLVNDLPVSRPERVVVELAAMHGYADRCEQVMHAARRQRLITLESMTATLDRLARRGRPGIQAVREALARWPTDGRPTESVMETKLLQLLRRSGLPEPVPQFEVFDEHGLFVARVDFGYPQWKALVEYDSDKYHTDEWSTARDRSRKRRIEACGYTLLSVGPDELRRGARDTVRQLRNLRQTAATVAAI